MRVNKGMKRMNSLPCPLLSSDVQGKPPPTCPAKHCSVELIPRPLHTEGGASAGGGMCNGTIM